MPVTLVTGTPGAGKSLYVVSQLSKIQDRPIYYYGIDDLALPWIELEDPFNWHKEVPDGAIVVIDEVQQVFPQRGTKKEVSDAVKFLEIHRHHGLDVYFITQMPKLLDHHARALVSHHIHLTRKLGWEYSVKKQSDEIMEISLKESSSVSGERFTFPKDSYQLYKSAEIHTVKKRIPPKLLLIPALLVVIGGLVVFVSNTLFGEEDDLVADTESAIQTPFQTFKQTRQTQELPALTPEHEFVRKHTPAIVHLPQTAPIYDQLYDPKDLPRTSACVLFEERDECTCWTQQATIVPTEFDTCKNIALNGYFDHTITTVNSNTGIISRREGQRQAADGVPAAPARGLLN